MGSAAIPREGQSQEARIVSCGATKRSATVKASCEGRLSRPAVKASCQHAGRTSMIDSTLRPPSHESISFDWRGVSLSLKKHACTV